MNNDWGAYLRELTGAETGSSVARRLGVSGSKVSYWRRGERPPSVSEAIRVSREYGRPPLEGLVAAGYLSASDVPEKLVLEQRSLKEFTDVELLTELLRRARAAED